MIEPATGLYWYFDVDPTAGAGIAAPLWQLGIRVDIPSLYYKAGAADTAWIEIGNGGGGIGSIELQDEGVPVVGGPFGTLNFTGNVGVIDGGGGVGTVNIPGGTDLSNAITPAALPAGDTTDYNPAGLAAASRIRQAVNVAGSTLTGLLAQGDGKTFVIENLGPSDLVLAHENAGSAVANRFSLAGGVDLVIPPGGSATVVYDLTLTKYTTVAIGRMTPVLNARDYGAVGDGVTDDQPAILRALTAASALKGKLFVPPGTYVLGRDGANPYSIFLPGGDITLFGVKGQTWFKHPAGLPNTPIRMFFCHQTNNVTISDIGFDGNWGNATTKIAILSEGAALPQATINVESTEGFPSSGSATVYIGGVAQVFTYTGVTATTFTGCAGGAGTLSRNDTVGYDNSQNGINQTTQADPNNHLVMIQDSQGWLIENCLFRQAYGDGIWMGHSSFAAELGYSSVTVRDTDFDMCARSGIAAGGTVDHVVVDNCKFTNIFAQAFDTEPGSNVGFCRDVTLDKSYFGGWWAPFPPRADNSPISIAGAEVGMPAQSSFARQYRMRDCTVIGSIGIIDAIDVRIEGCRIICDFDGDSSAPVRIAGFCDDIWIVNNYIFDRTGNAGLEHLASISVRWYGFEPTLQPANIKIYGNEIHCQNGRHGIIVEGTGGFGQGSAAVIPPTSGVASATTATTMTDAGAGWAVNAYAGWQVRIGDVWATVFTNTGEELTLTNGELTNNWCDPLGTPVATPAAGAYVLSPVGGVVDVYNNHIDCTDQGYGQGGKGIYIDTERAGMRVKIRSNTIRNALLDAVFLKLWDAAREILFLEISDNTPWDDQETPTCTNGVRFDGNFFETLVLRDNTPGQGVANEVAGLTSGQWKIGGSQWAGHGTPDGAIFARAGSTYQRVDGTGVLYVKETGVSFSTGWVALLARPRVAIRGFGTAVAGVGALTPGSAPSVEGDIEVLLVHNSTADAAISLTSAEGFVLLHEERSDSGVAVFVRCAVYVRRVLGVMVDPVVADNNNFNAAVCFSIKDCLEYGDPIDVIDVFNGTANNGITLPVSLDGDLSTVDGCLIVAVLSSFLGGTGSVSGWANGSLTEVEEQFDQTFNIGSDFVNLAVATGNLATAALFGATTATIAAVYAVWAGVVLAVKPLSGAIGVERITASGPSSHHIERTYISGVGTAVTLDNAEISGDGFIKTVVVSSGTGTFTPANLANGNVLTWTDFAGFELMWDNTGGTWHVVNIYGNVVVS
jgi:hypothetical protein